MKKKHEDSIFDTVGSHERTDNEVRHFELSFDFVCAVILAVIVIGIILFFN